MLRKSLATLPRTLDQTYDRILIAIGEEYSEYAMRILQWLTFSARPLSVEEVAERSAAEPELGELHVGSAEAPRQPSTRR